MNTGDRRECVISDTSVLINFLAVDRATLLVEHPQIHFFLTDHVRAEVTAHYPDQCARLDAALSDGSLQQLRVESPEELEIFATRPMTSARAAIMRRHYGGFRRSPVKTRRARDCSTQGGLEPVVGVVPGG